MYLISTWENRIQSTQDINTLARFYILLQKKCKDFNINIKIPDIDLNVSNYLPQNITSIIHQLRLIAAETDIQNLLETQNEGVSFTPERIDDMQQMINKLRDMVVASSLFDEPHKQRILQKLEKLQNELHTKVTNFDSFLTNTLRLGSTLGKFGKDALPFTNMVGKLVNTIRSCDNELKPLAIGEPNFFPALPSGEDEDKSD